MELGTLLIGRELAHRFQRDQFQRALVRGLKNDTWSHVVLVSLLPTRGAETPAAAGLETGESVLGHGGREVVAGEFGELKELGRQFHTNGVRTMILIIGVATTVAKESGHWIGAARLERTAQNIERFVGIDSCNHRMSSTYGHEPAASSPRIVGVFYAVRFNEWPERFFTKQQSSYRQE